MSLVAPTPAPDDLDTPGTSGLPERQTYTVLEAARLLGVCRATAYARARAGDIPTIRLGHRIVIPKSALARLLEGGQ